MHAWPCPKAFSNHRIPSPYRLHGANGDLRPVTSLSSEVPSVIRGIQVPTFPRLPSWSDSLACNVGISELGQSQPVRCPRDRLGRATLMPHGSQPGPQSPDTTVGGTLEYPTPRRGLCFPANHRRDLSSMTQESRTALGTSLDLERVRRRPKWSEHPARAALDSQP